MKTKKNCVYKFIDANNEIIYIGKCTNLNSRFSSHKNAPHLDKQCYSELREIDYVSFPTYMDAGIMERVLIAYYKPKYNVQFANEGSQSIVSSEQIKSIEWLLFDKFPDGLQLNEKKKSRMGVLDKADFCLYDGEGVVGDAYFFKIIRQNHKPKALRIIGCLSCVSEIAYDRDTLEEVIQMEMEKCRKCTEYPKRLLREKELHDKLDYLRYEQKMPFVYKGCGQLLYNGEDSSRIRYRYADEMYNNPKTIKTLAFAAALELLTRSGEIDEMEYSNLIGDVNN